MGYSGVHSSNTKNQKDSIASDPPPVLILGVTSVAGSYESQKFQLAALASQKIDSVLTPSFDSCCHFWELILGITSVDSTVQEVHRCLFRFQKQE